MKRSSVFGAAMVVACLVLAAAPPALAQVNLDIVIGVPPPPVVVEPVPPPRVGFLWAPGYWMWDGHRHAWRGGHWEPQREGEFYAGAQWVETPGGWRFVPAHWDQVDSHSKCNS